jgi:hypothetical protein
MTGAFRVPLNIPRAAVVRAGREGVPVEVGGRAIELVRESWLVEDRWWTAQPLRRRYWEAVTTSGRNIVVFHDLTASALAPAEGPSSGGWFVQGP